MLRAGAASPSPGGEKESFAVIVEEFIIIILILFFFDVFRNYSNIFINN